MSSSVMETKSAPAAVPPGAAQVWTRVGLFLGGQGISLICDQVFFVAVVWAADHKISPKTKQACGMLTGTVADGPVSSDPATRREEIHIRARSHAVNCGLL